MLDAGRAQLLNQLTFRNTEPSDEPILRDMLYLAVFVAPGTAAPDRSVVAQPELARYVRHWGRAGDDGIIVVASDGQPVGAAWVRLCPEDDRGYGFVDVHTPELTLAVRPEFRGCGIGTQLLRRMLHRADQLYEQVSLSVSLQNPAVRLYERLGFEMTSGDGVSMTMRRVRESTSR
jgi:ribosomal protein S18 acetylase RimI-like enzyme